MFDNKEDELFFSLLTNISLSSESTLERLTNSLKVFVRKYFDNQDFTPPENSLEIAMNCIINSESILYTVYELEKEASTEEEKLELLHYKDVVLKTLVVVTNLDFFVTELKENDLFKDAYVLREKVKAEFRLEADKINQNPDMFNYTEIKTRFFTDTKPIEHRKNSDEVKKTDTSIHYENQISLPEIKADEIISVIKGESESMSRLKKAMNESKIKKEVSQSSKEKKLRTSMGWEISQDFLENGLYADT